MADLSFDKSIEEYLVYCHARQLRQKTMNSYEQTLRLFQRWCYNELGITTVDAGSESVIRHYITSIQNCLYGQSYRTPRVLFIHELWV